MSCSPDTIAEIDLLLLFDLSSAQSGIKIHQSASPESIAAAQRLFEKGFIDQPDGGYLTHLGIEAAEHAVRLLALLNGPE